MAAYASSSGQKLKTRLPHLRLSLNRADDASFERVVNHPTRGIGDRTIDILRTHARSTNTSLWEMATRVHELGELTARAATAVLNFVQLINQMARDTAVLPLGERVQTIIEMSGLKPHF